AYLIQAANPADPALMVMALDMEDHLDPGAIRRSLSMSQVMAAQANVDFDAVTKIIASAKGMTFNIRPGNPLNAALNVDFDADFGLLDPFAKALLFEILQKSELFVPDFNDWVIQAKDQSLRLSGPLSVNALRKLGTLITTPAPNPVA